MAEYISVLPEITENDEKYASISPIRAIGGPGIIGSIQPANPAIRNNAPNVEYIISRTIIAPYSY
jgi:hypothetical protein